MNSVPSPAPACPQNQQACISLIIPIYRVEQYLAECLESAIQQTLQNIEIICVNDCSPDHSLAIAEEFAERDKRITVISNASNLGLAGSRNVGIRHSSAPYIMFMDSDDTYHPAMCEKMYQAIVSSGADIAACGIQMSYECDSEFRKGDEEYYALKFEGLHHVTDELVSTNDVSACNKIFRRELMERYEIMFPDGLKYEDAFFFNAYMAHAKSIVFVNEKLYFYRRRAGSIMNQTFARAISVSIDHLKIAFALHAYFLKWNLLEKKRAYFCTFFLQYVNLALHHSSSQQERDEILNMAGDFARRHLTNMAGLSADVVERLTQLKFEFKPQTQGWLIRVNTRPFCKRYSFLGIPLYNIKYSPKHQKHYLFGVQVYRKRYQ